MQDCSPSYLSLPSFVVPNAIQAPWPGRGKRGRSVHILSILIFIYLYFNYLIVILLLLSLVWVTCARGVTLREDAGWGRDLGVAGIGDIE